MKKNTTTAVVFTLLEAWTLQKNGQFVGLTKQTVGFINTNSAHEIAGDLQAVPYEEFNERYNQRDVAARRKMRELVDSDANRVTRVFSILLEER